MTKTISAFLLLIAVPVFAKLVRSATAPCDTGKIKASSVSVFQNPKTKAKWISLSEDSRMFFNALGFQNLKGVSAKFDGATNLKSCSTEKTFRKIYGTLTKSVSLVATNACEENVARSLGLTLSTPDNFGSMEATNAVPWATINLCTDGQKLYHCPQPTEQMAKCLARL